MNHYLRGLYDGVNGIAFLELQFIGAAASDSTFDEIVADADDDVGHDIAQLDFFNRASQFISSGNCHMHIVNGENA